MESSSIARRFVDARDSGGNLPFSPSLFPCVLAKWIRGGKGLGRV